MDFPQPEGPVMATDLAVGDPEVDAGQGGDVARISPGVRLPSTSMAMLSESVTHS